MMTERDREIFQTFARRVRERFPQAKIWAFGSRARGVADSESDFDVCIVMDHPGQQEEAAIQEIAWEVAFDNGLVFNTLLFQTAAFESGPMSESTLKENILREGVPA